MQVIHKRDIVLKLIRAADKSSRHTPPYRPLLEICWDSRWTAPWNVPTTLTCVGSIADERSI
jgi:hypothetical protein